MPGKVRELFRKIYEWELLQERPLWTLRQEFEKYDNDRMDIYRVPNPTAYRQKGP